MAQDKVDYSELDRREITPLLMEKLDRINGNVDDIKVIAQESARALKGHNSTPGIIASVQANAAAISRIDKKSNRNDVIVGAGTIIGTVVGYLFGGK